MLIQVAGLGRIVGASRISLQKGKEKKYQVRIDVKRIEKNVMGSSSFSFMASNAGLASFHERELGYFP